MKVNEKLLQKAIEWVLKNKPERSNEDCYILGVYEAMKKEVEKANKMVNA